MSDFFEGLAARSAGAATALRPRAASVYETRDGAGVVEDVPASASPARTRAAPVAQERADVAEPAERLVVRDVVLTRRKTHEAPPALLHDDRIEHGQRVEHDPRVEERVQRRVHELTREHTLEPTREQTHTHHEERIENVRELLATPRVPERQAEARPASSPADEPADHRGEASPLRRPQPTPLPRPLTAVNREQPAPIRQPPAPIRQAALDRQPVSDPVVRITIGRVEVRAVQPAQPAPRPAPPPVPQGPTLAEFLEQRERGK